MRKMTMEKDYNMESPVHSYCFCFMGSCFLYIVAYSFVSNRLDLIIPSPLSDINRLLNLYLKTISEKIIIKLDL